MSVGKRVLIVDDEFGIRFALSEFLRTRDLTIFEAENCRSAEEAFRSCKPDIAIIDNFLPDGTALELLPRLKAIDASVPVIVLTGNASIDLAVRAIKEGAEQFLTKPVDLPALVLLMERLLDAQRTRRRELASRTHPRRREPDPFFGVSPAIRLLEEQAKRVAGAESAIVIQGETGAGKGVLARWLHSHSTRSDEPFVDLNCAGLSRDFLETELFGHEKGSFTSAIAAKPGLFEMAHRGTLFLDEIGDIDPLVQPKVLKALEDKRFRRLGEVKDRTVDVRLIAASHHDLAKLVEEGRFRSDLYFRINTIPLRIPALRERPEDIPMLAQFILEDLRSELGRPEQKLSGDALEALRRYAWPGNVREMRNVLERAILLGAGDEIMPQHLMFDSQRQSAPVKTADPFPLSMTLDQMEAWYVEQILNDSQGKVEIAASRLGVPRSTLYQKLKKFKLDFGRKMPPSRQ